MSIHEFRLAPLKGDFGGLIQADGRRVEDLPPDFLLDAFQQHGAVLLRGFSADLDAFVGLTETHCRDFSLYRAGGFRWKSLDRASVGNNPTVMTTTGRSQTFAIPLHGEMYYWKNPPSIIWFYCETPPRSAGQTTLCDGRALFRCLSDETQSYFRGQEFLYVRTLPDGDWQTTFMTEDLDEVLEFCAANDVAVQVDPATGTLTAEYAAPAVVEDHRTADPVFINNLLLIYLAEWAVESGWSKENLSEIGGELVPIVVRTANRERIPWPRMEEVMKAGERLTTAIDWQRGDILMVDNKRVLHGRSATDGGQRSIVVRMGEPAWSVETATAAEHR